MFKSYRFPILQPRMENFFGKEVMAGVLRIRRAFTLGMRNRNDANSSRRGFYFKLESSWSFSVDLRRVVTRKSWRVV